MRASHLLKSHLTGNYCEYELPLSLVQLKNSWSRYIREFVTRAAFKSDFAFHILITWPWGFKLNNIACILCFYFFTVSLYNDSSVVRSIYVHIQYINQGKEYYRHQEISHSKFPQKTFKLPCKYLHFHENFSPPTLSAEAELTTWIRAATIGQFISNYCDDQ